MAAISYQLAVQGTLEQVTTGTAVPTGGSGFIEIRMDQTSVVTDASVVGGLRPIKKSEILLALENMQQYLIRDTNIS